MTDTTTATRTGRCACGAEVTRPAGEGKFAAFIDRMPFVCAACQAKAEESDQERERDFEHDAQVRRRQQRRVLSGIPDRLADLRLEQLDPCREVFAAQEWLRRAADDEHKHRRGLVLTGNVGVGKTHLAAAAAGTLLDIQPLRWLTGPLLLARLGTGMGTPERHEILSVLLGRKAIVLDDLDKARASDYGAEQVFAAIDTRVTEGVPLLITTNLDLAELAERWPQPYGEAIASRLVGFCEVVHMQGPDRRMEAAA